MLLSFQTVSCVTVAPKPFPIQFLNVINICPMKYQQVVDKPLLLNVVQSPLVRLHVTCFILTNEVISFAGVCHKKDRFKTHYLL
jgi:hypothetical protein